MESKGDVPINRYAHASAFTGTQLIIFGGLDGQRFSTSELYICETNSASAREQFDRWDKKKKKLVMSDEVDHGLAPPKKEAKFEKLMTMSMQNSRKAV